MTHRTPLSILMPLKDQKPEFLADALNSVLKQTSPLWTLHIVVAPTTPEALKSIIGSFQDDRIRVHLEQAPGLGGALNTGMRLSDSDHVCILLSDDRLDVRAVEVLQQHVQDFPDVDFFYSSRRYIDASGKFRSPVMESADAVRIDAFTTSGSPVKHLLCWRRLKGLEIGGMDETLSLHGCDDFDFPWRMAEAGCRFQAIKDCLYHYRIHHDFHRLTTDVPLMEQVDILSAMFRKHGVSEARASKFIADARSGYLIEDKRLDFEEADAPPSRFSHYWEITDLRLGEFRSAGINRDFFFPHRIYYFPRWGPDALRLARRMCGIEKPGRMCEVVLYADSRLADKLPSDLFFEKDVLWHQQQFGKKGHVALAYLVVEGKRLYAYQYVSDLVQRISRRRDHKTVVERTFKGWNRMLLNAVMNFAVQENLDVLYSATADLALRNTDPSRVVQRELFDRVYDRGVLKNFAAEREGDWWKIDVRKNRKSFVEPVRKRDMIGREKEICICHDIEREIGHLEAEPDFASSLNGSCATALESMLKMEKEAGVRATYHVVGLFFDEVRERIERDGHEVAFHSYDHRIAKERGPLSYLRNVLRTGRAEPYSYQLSKCREIDYRIKGYRPAQSKITSDLSDAALNSYNFEWFASSASSLRLNAPEMQNGVVKIPILFDDFDLHKKGLSYDEWEAAAIDKIKKHDFVALCLHDCYAEHWLPRYRSFLEKIRPLGKFRTLNDVSSGVILRSGQ